MLEVDIKEKNKRLFCADGFNMSVQANSGAYCEPRNDEGPYSELEIGYPSQLEELLMPWAENPERPTHTVYAYVPSDVVLEVILKHGGFTKGDIPKMEMALSNNYPGNR